MFRVMLLAAVVDVVYQLFVEGWFYPLETIVLVMTVAVLPYLVIRTVINPASKFMKKF